MEKARFLGVLGLTLIAMSVVVATGCAKKQARTSATVEPQTVRAPGERVAPPDTPFREDTPTITESDIDRPVSVIELEDIFFDFDQATLRREAKTILDQNIRWLRSRPDARILIEGHADERGTTEYNLALGARRAKAVRDYLIASGIQPGRIEIISYGEERPFCTERNEHCYQQNRRGHFVLIQQGGEPG